MYIYIDKLNKDQEIFICIDIYSLLFKLLKLENANFWNSKSAISCKKKK